MARSQKTSFIDSSKLRLPVLDCAEQQSYYVAFSGGADSTVLLHLMCQLQKEQHFSLTALHVNHNLHPDSQRWAEHCERICKQWGVPFLHTSLQLSDNSENSARDARYAWFREQLPAKSALLTAHHRQDRVETLLFNLMRGAGSTGLSSLRASRPFQGATLLRPMLSMSRADIMRYAQDNQLSWVEDPSNATTEYSRNQIRHQVLPALTEFRPDALQNIARAAENLEQENSLLREVAICDLVEVREHPKHPLDNSHALCFDDVVHLSPNRQANLVRFWLRSLQLHVPSKRLLTTILNAFNNPPNSTAIMQEGGYQFRFYRGYMYVMPAQEQAPSLVSINWKNVEQPVDIIQQKMRVGSTDKLRHLWSSHRKASLRLVSRADVVNPKALQGHSLNLKTWLQDIGVPPWRRQAVPLLTMAKSNNEVVLGPVDQEFQSDWVHLQCSVG